MLYFSLFLNAVYSTSNTVQSLCTFQFYFGFAQKQHLHSIELQAILLPVMRLCVRPSNLLKEQFGEVEEKKAFCTIHIVLFTGRKCHAEMIADVE